MTYGVAVVGCGLIGRRRAQTAALHENTRLVGLVDVEQTQAAAVAGDLGGAVFPDVPAVLDAPEVDIVVVATPNGFLADIGVAALKAGKHVLLEKPMGRNLAEAHVLADAARESGRVLKIGFNHRYHPGLERLLDLVRSGELGQLVHIRARYGHGGRAGFEGEWRADPELAGGGHLMDQGVHLVDLIHGVAGLPAEAVAFLQTAVWDVAPLEDNAYGMFRYPGGQVAQVQVGMTQWKNLFSFEVFGDAGSAAVEGLGGSYGLERLVRVHRNRKGGVPETEEHEFPGPDVSWTAEWSDFVHALDSGSPTHGGVQDGLAAMRMLDALYRSARDHGIVEV